MTWQNINEYVPVWGSDHFITATELQEILEEAFVAASGEYNMRTAQVWAQGYEFPASMLGRDLRAFYSAGSLEQFCTNRHAELCEQRLNIDRVYATFRREGTDVPGVLPEDFVHLCELATEGIELITPDNFTPNLSPPPLRNKYVKVSNCCNKLIAKQVEAGTVVVLPLDTVLQIPYIHFSCQHWTEKKGKAEGRILGDLAHPANPDEVPVNGKAKVGKTILRALVEKRWGKIRHPTLIAICHMILQKADQYGWDEIILWKMDLQGAFNLLWFKARDTHLLAFPLTNELVAIHLAGMFGWVGMPFVFQVITRLVLALVTMIVIGCVLMYVDDIIGVSPKSTVERDMALVHERVSALLGINAIAVSKNESGEALDIIGWNFDLIHQSVTVSKRNLLKALYAFYEFGHTKRVLPALARADVCVWRGFLVMSRANPINLCKPIASFGKRDTSMGYPYDASLHTIAVGVYRRHEAPDRIYRHSSTVPSY
jgi:hypothetical protein